jgi:photosystem II stability/assembly factor-like uncharacterized protein
MSDYKRCLTGVVFLILLSLGLNARLDMEIFSGMKARSIGPAGMSGRVAAVDAVNSNPTIIYVGAATGGLWKSTSGGITWEPIFDRQPVSSIGAVTVYQPNPSILWVGTGEGNPRNSMGVGNGIYKSIDAGKTWNHLGLTETERIHRIIVDPKNPDIVYVAAMGKAWGESPERGVFKSIDGGKSWQKTLFVNNSTGCADLVMDPANPQKLFAAMWEYRRWPWFFKSGGKGSGLYVTHDGGKNWKKITAHQGLPAGELGRIGLAIAAGNPNVVYALVEAKPSALCKSEDGGSTWKIVNQKKNVNPRPFYYCDIRVDPANENRVYGLNSRLVVSDDGGKNFNTIGGNVHSDHHALWINPNNTRHIIEGNDGGIAISYDGGKNWRLVDNIPLAQFYHINVDMEIPYNVYGGLQDNGSWRGPSDVWENGGIRNYHWQEVGFGDGFGTLIDPNDNNVGYCMFQGGLLMRFNVATGEKLFIRPDGPEDVKLRFNWNAAIAIEPIEKNTLYYGSQFLHKSTDRGETWEIISPDLTTNDSEKQKQSQSGGITRDITSAENHTTIITIAPSPVQKGVIWVGTDDGNVQLTIDGGKTWNNVVKNIKGLPAATWCPHIEASKFDAKTAYAVFDDHRRSNWNTYVFKTGDFGKTWKSLTRNDPTINDKNLQWGFAHVIEQDPVKKDLLYLGTEFGLWISFDDGNSWNRWTHGLPTCPVRALIVHPREHDLVIGTHGRAAYILDDVRPLRSINNETLTKPLHLFEIPSVYQHQVKQAAGYHFTGDSMYSGDSKKYGVMLTYLYNPRKQPEKKDAKEQNNKDEILTIQALDKEGNVIWSDKAPRKKGLNRFVWNLRTKGIKLPGFEMISSFLPTGISIIPGTYTIKIKQGDFESSQTVNVIPDFREKFTMKDRKEKYDALVRAEQNIKMLGGGMMQIKKTVDTLDFVINHLKGSKKKELQEIVREAGALKMKLGKFSAKIMGGGDMMNSIGFHVLMPFLSLSTSFDAPTPSQKKSIAQSQKILMKAANELFQLYNKDVAEFKKKYRKANIDLFKSLDFSAFLKN